MRYRVLDFLVSALTVGYFLAYNLGPTPHQATDLILALGLWILSEVYSLRAKIEKAAT